MEAGASTYERARKNPFHPQAALRGGKARKAPVLLSPSRRRHPRCSRDWSSDVCSSDLPNTPRADAGNGLWLRGDGQGHFTPAPAVESGFLAPLDVTGLALIKTPTGKAVLVANHGDSLQAFAIRRR